MKFVTIILLLFSGIASAATTNNAVADKLPQSEQTSNVTCPAPKLLPILDATYHECSNGYDSGEKCETFVNTYRKLLPKYDCQHGEGELKFRVSALLMANGPGAVEDYTRLLWRMSSLKDETFKHEQFQKAVSEARILFGSKEFQKILDGDLGEAYFDRSKKVERELKNLGRILVLPTPVLSLRGANCEARVV